MRSVLAWVVPSVLVFNSMLTFLALTLKNPHIEPTRSAVRTRVTK